MGNKNGRVADMGNKNGRDTDMGSKNGRETAMVNRNGPAAKGGLFKRVRRFVGRNKLLVLVAVAYLVLGLFMPEKAAAAFNSSLYYLWEMVQVLPVIFVFTVVIEAWIPKSVIMKGLGENSGVRGWLLSLALGSLSAGPIYAAFPIGKALMNKGASVTNLVIILSSWAVIKVPMLANEAKFLGPQFMAVRWVLTVSAIFLMGWAMGKIVRSEELPGAAVGKEDIVDVNEPVAAVDGKDVAAAGINNVAGQGDKYLAGQGNKYVAGDTTLPDEA
jgi:uncharacterized membrane protein YraQ (UPF0718 family)